MLSSDSSSPLVVVIGATGAQGGSVITNLLASDKPYRFRGITRDATKGAALALTKKGIEMVSCTLSVDNEEGIKKAFEGASIVFAVTNFWEHASKDREVAEGKLLIDIAKEIPTLSLFVWSGLENVTTGSKGKYPHVLHFDGKAEVSDYGRASGIPFAVVQPGFYASNLLGNLGPRKQADGTFIVALPVRATSKFAILDTEHDFGLFVQEAIESDKFGPGSEVLAAGEEIEFGKLVEILATVTGKTIKYVELTQEQFEKPMPMPENIKKELSENMLWIQDFGYYGDKDITPSLAHLARPARTWEDFVKASDWSNVLA